MLFSIIIPAFNSEKYIGNCIHSIEKQAISDYEIIVVDDNSSDNTKQIIQDFSCRLKNIKYVRNVGRGVSDARNTGIANAVGDYIIFIDSDDEIFEGLFKKIVPYCKQDYDCIKYNAVYQGGDFDEKDDRFFCNKFKNKTGEDALIDFCKQQKIFATPWMYAAKKNIYINNNLKFPTGRVHEDVAIMPLVILLSKKVCSLDFVGYKYIQHKESIMNDRSYQKKIERAYDFLYIYDFLHEKISALNIGSECQKVFFEYLSKRINCKILQLKDREREDYVNELNKRMVDSWILDGEKIAKKYR